METCLQKSAALVALAAIAIGCTPGHVGTGGSSTDTPKGPAHAATIPGHADRKPSQQAKPTDESGGGKAIKARTELSGLAQEADTSPPGATAEPERPWASNTGPSNPKAITPYTGPSAITTNGAVIENFAATGRLTVDAANVTLRNFTIDGNGVLYPLRVLSTSSGLVAEDGEIYDGTSTLVYDQGGNNTFRRLYLHDSAGDGFKTDGSGTLVESCFVEKLGTGAGAHADVVQNQAGSSRDQIYRWNNFFLPAVGTPPFPGAPYKSNASFIFNDFGSFSNIVIENNWLDGGNYTIYCIPGVYVRNNLFGRNYTYGIRSSSNGGECSGWTGNRWEDTGDPM